MTSYWLGCPPPSHRVGLILKECPGQRSAASATVEPFPWHAGHAVVNCWMKPVGGRGERAARVAIGVEKDRLLCVGGREGARKKVVA